MKRKYVAVLMVILCLSSIGLGYSLARIESTSHAHRDPKTKANVFILYETSKGTWTGQGGNVATDGGEQYERNILGFDNVTAHNATKWISVGNGTISQTETKLDSEATTANFTRGLGIVTAWMNGTDYGFQVTYKFMATGTIRINASYLHWNPTSNSADNGYAGLLIDSPTTFNSGDNCTITWRITKDNND